MTLDSIEAEHLYDPTFSQAFSQPIFQIQSSPRFQRPRTKSQRTTQKTTPKDITLYKTELCRNWIELGTCRYGDKCRYAHGEEEIRSLRRHARYKTEICRAYHSDGTCPYGTRCTYIHDVETALEKKPAFLSKADSLEPSSLESLWKTKLGLHLESTKSSFPVVSSSGFSSLFFSNDESASENSFSGDESVQAQSPPFSLVSLEQSKYKKPSFSVPYFFNKANSMWM